MAWTWYRRTVDACVPGGSSAGGTRDYLAWRVGAQPASAGFLPKVELSPGRRARVPVRSRPTKRHPDGAQITRINADFICAFIRVIRGVSLLMRCEPARVAASTPSTESIPDQAVPARTERKTSP